MNTKIYILDKSKMTLKYEKRRWRVTKHLLLPGHVLLFGCKIMCGGFHKIPQKCAVFSQLILQTVGIYNKVLRWATGIVLMHRPVNMLSIKETCCDYLYCNLKQKMLKLKCTFTDVLLYPSLKNKKLEPAEILIKKIRNLEINRLKFETEGRIFKIKKSKF